MCLELLNALHTIKPFEYIVSLIFHTPSAMVESLDLIDHKPVVNPDFNWPKKKKKKEIVWSENSC